MRARALSAVVVAAVVAGGCASGHDSASTGNRSSITRGSTTTGATARASAAPTAPPALAATVPGRVQQEEAALPIAIQEAAAASAGDSLYVVGGYDMARNSSAAVFVSNGSVWHRGPALPIPVNHPGAAAIGADVYVAGGFTTSGAATNRVFVLASGATGWRELTPMSRARGALAFVAIGDRLYAIGGRDGTAQIATPERYDPASGRWVDLPAMPAPRNHVAGYVDGTLICVAGGRTPGTSAAIDCLDTSTTTWEHRATLPTATSGASAAVVDGVTIVAGGEPSGEATIVGVVQRLRHGAWTAEPMLVPRHGAAFAIFRGRLWACGGATEAGFHAVPACTSLRA